MTDGRPQPQQQAAARETLTGLRDWPRAALARQHDGLTDPQPRQQIDGSGGEMSQAMRLFTAIMPPPAVLAELEERAAPLRPAWPGLRWTGQDAWHVTLAFLGEVGEEVLPELSARLERAARRHPRIELSIGGAGAFPAAARARVVWAGVRADEAALAGLAASVAAGARRAGAPPPDEGRRYRPHLTLARCRDAADVGPLVGALDGFAGTPWIAGEILLIRSQTGQQPRYQSAGSWPLRPGPPASVTERETAPADLREGPRRVRPAPADRARGS